MNPSLDSLKSYLGQGPDTPTWTPTPRVVVVGAGKGGVGSSTLSVLLALAGARDRRRVLLVDADESVGSLHMLLGVAQPEEGIGALRGGNVTPFDLLQPLADNLWLIPGGGGGVDATLSVGLGERRVLLRRVAGIYEGFDLVVVDGGSHLSSVLAACWAGAERLLALTTPDRVAMAATYALLKVGRRRFPLLPVEIVVNRCTGVPPEEVFQLVATAGQRFLGTRVLFGGAVSEDLKLEAHQASGGALLNMDPMGEASEQIDNLHARLAAEQESASPGGPAVFSASVRH